jgi:ADP-L-glycero-D-manno-heptose 6-epimerase
MRVLVTGSAGFIGRTTTESLARAGFEVTGVDRVAGHRSGQAAVELELDIADPTLLRAVGRGDFEAVIHLAAIVDTTSRDRRLMVRENTEKALELATAAGRGGATLLAASSFAVYGAVEGRTAIREGEELDGRCSGPLTPYAESKLLLERGLGEVLEGAPFWAALRFTNVFGPCEERKGAMASMAWKVAAASAAGSRIELFDDTLDAARDYVPVAVVAERLRAMIPGDGEPGVYNMGSGTAVSFAELLDWCRARSPRDPEVALVPNPHVGAYQYWTCADMQRWGSQFGDREQDGALSRDQLRAAVERLVDRLGREGRC